MQVFSVKVRLRSTSANRDGENREKIDLQQSVRALSHAL